MRRERDQATAFLMRSMFCEARFDSGWIASPVSLTSDSVRREPSETMRSNDVRAISLCSWKNSVGDLASAKVLTASEACSTPSRPRATMSWPRLLAPVAAIRPAVTKASTFALATSANCSAASVDLRTASWLRSPASANRPWNLSAPGRASNLGKLPRLANQLLVSMVMKSFLSIFAAAIFGARMVLVRRAGLARFALTVLVTVLARRAGLAAAFAALAAGFATVLATVSATVLTTLSVAFWTLAAAAAASALAAGVMGSVGMFSSPGAVWA